MSDHGRFSADDVSQFGRRIASLLSTLTAHIGSRGSAHTAVTTAENGFMSAADKVILNREVTMNTIVLTAAGWSEDGPPFTQTVAVTGMTVDAAPEVGPVYSDDFVTARAQMYAWHKVNEFKTAAGTVTFRCLKGKPLVDITAQIKGV